MPLFSTLLSVRFIDKITHIFKGEENQTETEQATLNLGLLVPEEDDAIFSPGDLPNQHMVIVGASGSGKTFTIRNVLTPQVMRSGIKIFCLEHNEEFLDFMTDQISRVEAVNGIDLNPLAITATKKDEGLFVDSMMHSHSIADHLDQVFRFGVIQRDTVVTAIQELYRSYGLLGTRTEVTETRVWPRFSELFQQLDSMQTTQSRTVLARLRALFDYNIFRGTSGSLDQLLNQNTVVALGSIGNSEIASAVSSLLLCHHHGRMAEKINKEIRFW